MAFSEFELANTKQAIDEFIGRRRPPPAIREEVDIGFRIEGQSVYIFEMRPDPDTPTVKHEGMIAKATYVGTRKLWKIYWQRADLRWHRYEPVPEVKHIDAFIEVVDADTYGCFWG